MSAVIVVDLGSSKIAALIAEENSKGDLRVLGWGMSPCTAVSKGVVLDVDILTQAIKQAVESAEKRAALTLPTVTVGMGGTHIKGVTTQGMVPLFPRGRTITREDVLQVINHSRQIPSENDREQVLALPREFRVDGRRGITQPVGEIGNELQVVTYLVTAPSAHLGQVESAIQNVGKELDQVVIDALGSGLAALSQDEIKKGAAVVDIGSGSTEVGIYLNGSLADSFFLPIGSRHVTSDLAQLLKCSIEHAEELKISHGIAQGRLANEGESVEVLQVDNETPRPMQRKVLGEIIESRIREIAKMVARQLDEHGHLPLLSAGLVLTGGGSQLKGIDQVFQEVTKVEKVRVSHPAAGQIGEDGARYTAALGLAKYALQCGKDDLMPASGNGWKDRVRTFWSLFAPN